MNGNLFCSNSRISDQVSFPEIQKTIQLERAKAKPLINNELKDKYKSIWHFAEHMRKNPSYLVSVSADKVERSLTGKLITSSSRTHHYLMYDEELVKQFGECETFWDGTFDARPQIIGVGQMFTLMATNYNNVCINVLPCDF